MPPQPAARQSSSPKMETSYPLVWLPCSIPAKSWNPWSFGGILPQPAPILSGNAWGLKEYDNFLPQRTQRAQRKILNLQFAICHSISKYLYTTNGQNLEILLSKIVLETSL
jgi:hypothetical protein